MKKLALVLMFISSVASALPGGGEGYAFETQALTRATPTVADFTITVGTLIGKSLWLMEMAGFRVSVCATSGQTLSGAGTLQAWLLDERSGLVMRNPGLDMAISASGTRCQVFPDIRSVMVSSGRVIYAASGVTVSGGATVDVQILGDRM